MEDLSKLTVDDIKSRLVAMRIDFKSKERKADLLVKLENALIAAHKTQAETDTAEKNQFLYYGDPKKGKTVWLDAFNNTEQTAGKANAATSVETLDSAATSAVKPAGNDVELAQVETVFRDFENAKIGDKYAGGTVTAKVQGSIVIDMDSETQPLPMNAHRRAKQRKLAEAYGGTVVTHLPNRERVVHYETQNYVVREGHQGAIAPHGYRAKLTPKQMRRAGKKAAKHNEQLTISNRDIRGKGYSLLARTPDGRGIFHRFSD